MVTRRSGNARSKPSATSGSAHEFTDDSCQALEEKLGYRFSDPRLLSLALSHASVGQESNERLEFLGDRVLGLIVAEKLYADFPNQTEGGLAVRLNALVRREACSKVAEDVGLAPYLIMAKAESGSGGRQKSAILSGACEAVIAAIYLDGGLDAARNFIMRYWQDAFSNLKPELRDAKTALQEWSQAAERPDRSQPRYSVKERVGPDHSPFFTVEVRIAGQEPECGEGPTKRDAEQDAARRLLQRLGVWSE
ncbi:MAG TPA: ribonuclease III [Micropepsaceae bacterium]|nr:ribonuclease III [Micropepsaceae bacterium]